MRTSSPVPARRVVGLILLAIGLGACGASQPADPTGRASTPPPVAASTAAPAAATAAPVATSSALPPSGPAEATAGPPVASCTAPASPTTAQTEGPYFKAGSPATASLVAEGMPGTRLTLVGVVVTTSCRPIAGATLDVWQADASGAYDNAGFRLRGHVTTADDGTFRIATLVPGEYPGRTPHIHVKVTARGSSTLTTQLYLPDSAHNSDDGIFRPELVMAVSTDGDALVGRYTFVVDLP